MKQRIRGLRDSQLSNKEREEKTKSDLKDERPYSPINKELIYMDKVERFMKRQGITPRVKFDEIVVNNDKAM